jgi:hypothetical protein
MTTRNIDTHRFVKEFIAASKGADHIERQAEVIVETITKAQDSAFDNLTTKQDLQAAEKDFSNQIDIVNKNIKALESNLTKEIKNAMLTTIISIGAIIIGGIGFIEWFFKHIN